MPKSRLTESPKQPFRAAQIEDPSHQMQASQPQQGRLPEVGSPPVHEEFSMQASQPVKAPFTSS